MKYSPKLYARAFAKVVSRKLSPLEEKTFLRNFLELVRRNGDSGRLRQIFSETEKAVREKTGQRKVILRSARPLSPSQIKNLKFLKTGDLVEQKIDPELIAGIKVVLNDAEQWDGSLKRKLESLFNQPNF